MSKKRLSVLFVIICAVIGLLLTVNLPIRAADYTVEQWQIVEITLTSSETYDNPYMDVSITATFTGPGGSPVITWPGYWDGGDTWKVRFAPTKVGLWSYTITCSDTSNTGLHNQSGTIQANAYSGSLDIYEHGFLKVSPDKRYLVHDDGTPFFYLGDTHWFMQEEKWDECNKSGCTSQFKHMIDERVTQGYTVYQSHPYPPDKTNQGSTIITPTAFIDLDQRFEYIANVGLMHAFGIGCHDNVLYLNDNDNQPDGPKRFAKYMAARYGAYPTLFFTSQEVDCCTAGNADRWKKAYDGWNEVDGYDHIVTNHMICSTSGPCFLWADDAKHDMQFLQSGHGTIKPISHYQAYWNYNNETQPFLEAEANYEEIEMGGLPNDAYLVRVAAYKAIQTGSAGFGYGANGIWNNCYTSSDCSCCESWGIDWWADALDFDGGAQMSYVKEFYTSLEWWNLVPRFIDSAWASFTNTEESVLKTNSRDVYVTYFYKNGTTATGTLKNMYDGTTYTAKWFNPRTGAYTTISTNVTSSGGEWTIPSRPDSNDWLLLVTNNGSPAPTITPTPTPTPSGPKGEWKLDGNANDSSGNNNNGTLYGGAYESGKSGQAVHLDGSDDYVNVPDSSTLEGMDGLTVAAWVKLDTLPSSENHYIPVGKEEAYRFIVGSAGGGHLVVATTNNGWYTSGTTAGFGDVTLATGTWYYLVGVYDGSYVRMYIDGQFKASGPQAISGAIVNNSYALRFGHNFAIGNVEFTDGLVDEVRVYDRALSAADIQDLYDSYGDGPTPTPTPTPSSTNLALNKTYASSSNWDGNQTADKACDGTLSTHWQAGNGTATGQGFNNSWVEVNFGTNTTFDKVRLSEYGSRTTGYKIQYWNGSSWLDAYTGTTLENNPNFKMVTFGAVTGSKARVLFTSGTEYSPIIFEFEIYNDGASTPTPTPTNTPTPTSTPTNTPTPTPTPSLVSEWRLDNNANDSVGSNHGTAYGGAYETGKKNQAIHLDGVDDYVNVPDSGTLDGMSGLTFGAWVKLDTLPGQNYTIGKEYAYRLAIGSNGGVHFVVKTTNNDWYSTGTNVNCTTTLSTNTWYHLVGTYDGSRVRCYVDGQKEGTGSQDISGNIYSGSDALRFGHKVSSNINWLDGLVDEVRLYDQSLSDVEVESLYDSY